jgi:hypothetical protein
VIRAERGILQVGEVPEHVQTSRLQVADHQLQPRELLAKAGELPVDAGEPPVQDSAALRRVVGRVQRLTGEPSGRLIFQQPADLGDREPGIVTKALDRADGLNRPISS